MALNVTGIVYQGGGIIYTFDDGSTAVAPTSIQTGIPTYSDFTAAQLDAVQSFNTQNNQALTDTYDPRFNPGTSMEQQDALANANSPSSANPVATMADIQLLALPQEYDHNPVLDPATDRAYYPSVLYFSDGFDVGTTNYRYLAIHSADTDAGGGLLLAGSSDFMTWEQLNGGDPLNGLPSTAHHAQVVQLEDNLFRIYYWNSAVTIFNIATLRTALSTDLINWTNDQPLQNGTSPIITGNAADWNGGSYGICAVFYNPSATNQGDNPYDYTYAVIYDGTTGAFQSLGLAYSTDGVTFNSWGRILDHGSDTWGNSVPWDSSYVTACTVWRTPLDRWIMLYSGGQAHAHEGIGAAVSGDGLVWHKTTVINSLLERVNGTWRESRCYTPSAVVDYDNRFAGAGEEADVKILVSGRDSGGNYTCGYFRIPYIYADMREALYRLGKL